MHCGLSALPCAPDPNRGSAAADGLGCVFVADEGSSQVIAPTCKQRSLLRVRVAAKRYSGINPEPFRRCQVELGKRAEVVAACDGKPVALRSIIQGSTGSSCRPDVALGSPDSPN